MALTQISTAGVKDDAVTSGKIPANAVGSSELADNAVDTAAIADDAVTAAKLANTSVTAASYGSSTSIPSITVDAQGRITAASGNTVNTDLVGDTSPQLGGDLQSNGNDIDFADDDKAIFGNSEDLKIYHSGGNSWIEEAGSGNFYIGSNGAGTNIGKGNASGFEASARFYTDGAVELYHDNSKKFETTSAGATVTGTCTATAFAGDGSSLTGLSAFVSGMIILWSGAANAIPSGFVICDGNNSTPNLQDRFVVGAGSSYSVGDTGGASTVTLSTSELPSHSHTTDNHAHTFDAGSHSHSFSGSGSSSHSHTFPGGNSGSGAYLAGRRSGGVNSNQFSTNNANVSISVSGNTGNASASGNTGNSNLTTNNTGSGSAHENRPPYYALCYIMKT